MLCPPSNGRDVPEAAITRLIGVPEFVPIIVGSALYRGLLAAPIALAITLASDLSVQSSVSIA